MNHFHFSVIANDGMLKNRIHYIHPVAITFIGFESEEQALALSSNLIKRKHYNLHSVWQCNTCSFQANLTSTLNKVL